MGRAGERIRRAAVLGAVVAGAGCAASEDPTALLRTGGTETVFLVQSEVPDAVMDALFQGIVVRDDAGCLRLDTEARPTAVWPAGFSLVAASGGLTVRDAQGAEVGRIGGAFRLGGGNVPDLHDGLPISDATREIGRTRCPGTYWIVGGVYPG